MSNSTCKITTGTVKGFLNWLRNNQHLLPPLQVRKSIVVNTSLTLAQQFEKECALNGHTPADVLRQFMREYIIETASLASGAAGTDFIADADREDAAGDTGR